MSALPLRTPWRGAVFAAVFALIPAVAWLGPLGFAPLAALAGLLLLPAWSRAPSAWPGLALLGLLAVWAVGSLGWSPAAPRRIADYSDVESLTALKLVLQLGLYGLMAAAAGGLSGAAADRGLRLLSFGLAALAVVLLMEGVTGARLYQWIKATFEDPIRPDLAVRNVGQGAVALALLIWPAFLWLRPRVPLAAALLVLSLVVSPFLLGQLSPLAAGLAGGVAALLVRRWGARGGAVVGALVALNVLATPWLVRAADAAGWLSQARASLTASWDARLGIWSHAAARAAERPLAGWGLDASRHFGLAVPLHPHNGPLQVWLELGAVGAVLLAVFWGALFVAIGRAAESDRVGGAACGGAAGAYFTVGALSFGVWQEWWLALGALTAAVCAALMIARRRERLAGGHAELRPGELAPL